MWNEPPSFEVVKEAFARYGELKATISALEEYISASSLAIRKANPRKPILVQEAFQNEYAQLGTLKAEQQKLEQQLAFLNYWKEMYKAGAFYGK